MPQQRLDIDVILVFVNYSRLLCRSLLHLPNPPTRLILFGTVREMEAGNNGYEDRSFKFLGRLVELKFNNTFLLMPLYIPPPVVTSSCDFQTDLTPSLCFENNDLYMILKRFHRSEFCKLFRSCFRLSRLSLEETNLKDHTSESDHQDKKKPIAPSFNCPRT